MVVTHISHQDDMQIQFNQMSGLSAVFNSAGLPRPGMPQ